MVKMSIHSLFDQRKALEIIIDVFLGKNSITQYYCGSFVNNVLKQFHSFTETFNASDSSLEAPRSRMFAQKKEMTAEEETSMAKYDLQEFLYPYKKVKGDYTYLNNLNATDDLSGLFDLIITFLQACQRP